MPQPVALPGLRVPRPVVVALGLAALAVSAVYVWRSFDEAAFSASWRAALAAPGEVALALAAYGLAFLVRAAAWSRILPGLSVSQGLAAIHLSLAANHALPFRLGEAVRVVAAVRRAAVSLRSATASTVMLRASDALAVLALVAILGPSVAAGVLGAGVWVLPGLAAGVWIASVLWLRRLARGGGDEVRMSLVVAGLAATVAWLLESVVLWRAAHWAGIEVGFAEAVFVTSLTMAAQIVAVAPGGFGTYEAAATAALVGLGAAPGPALAAALVAHAFAFAYAALAGAITLLAPFGSPARRAGRNAPGMALARALPPRPSQHE